MIMVTDLTYACQKAVRNKKQRLAEIQANEKVNARRDREVADRWIRRLHGMQTLRKSSVQFV